MLPSSITREISREPLNYLLIGASGGLPEHWRPYAELLNVIGFEPDSQSFNRLRQTENEKYLNIGLSDHQASVTLYHTKNPAVASIFKPNQDFLDLFGINDYFHITGQSEIKVDTLDHLYQADSISDGDFLQLDTQGSELLILEGAKTFLKSHVFGIEVEVEFAPLYQNQPLFSHVDQYLQSLGFSLFDLRPQYYKRRIGIDYGNRQGQLLTGDALYLRSLPSYFQLVDRCLPEKQKLKFFYAVMICLHYGYLDYALDLTKSSRGWLFDDERRCLEDEIKSIRSSERILPNFPGRGRLSKYFQKMADWLRAPNRRGRLRGTIGNAKLDH